MKKTIITLGISALSMFFFTQCTKTDSSPSTTVNYSPLTNGSNWTYRYTEGTSAPSTFKLTATNNDTVVNSRTYKILTNSAGSNNYSTKDGSLYYRLASFPTLNINNFEDLYLQDNKNVNDTWTSTATINYSGLDIKVNLTYTIKGKDESRTVNGTAFNKVIHVRLDLALQGTSTSAGGGDFYYQEGVGMVESLINVTSPFGQNYTSHQELTAYEIK